LSSRSAKRSEKRRDQIVQAAVRLFSEQGYYQTTMDDIAKAADVSKGLIYLYFKDKNDVLFYTLRFVLEMYESDVAPTLVRNENPLAMLRLALHGLCRLVNEHVQETVLAYRSSKDLSKRQRLEIKVGESKIGRVFRGCLEACIHERLMVPLNLDVMVYQYIMFCHTWALKNWAFRDKYTFDEYLAEGERILITAFLTAKGRKLFETLHEPAVTV
jgi:AcrR family transcriptional regulator